MDLEMLRRRAEIIRQVRDFFDSRGYLALDTPLLSPDLIPESCLEVFQTMRLYPAGSKKEAAPLWLVPSPEIWMKKIIAQHRVSVYQICKCFRNGEATGHLHSPEFSMLEYYTVDADYIDSIGITEELFSHLSPDEVFRPPFDRVTVAEAFRRWAGFDLFAAAEKQGVMERQARRLGLDPLPGMNTAALYDLIFIHAVEPHLKTDRPVFLTDYPAFVPCLAKQKDGGQCVERWELYFRGIELANCFSEETDCEKVRAFFESEAAEKERSAIATHNVDHGYWKMFLPDGHGRGFPRSSGSALGLDRLIMALCGRATIDGVLPFAGL
ncbi:MAG: LysR family transcriptional regulator [Spirochaetes bacterium]|nr:LysR family transcriptional regulator [Spirochaetota bacterium]